MDEALDKAVRVFSERGYHATSIGDLSDAMQLAQGSVYKAFKDKRAVFIAAFDRARTQRLSALQHALAKAETGLERLRILIEFYAEASQGEEGRRGCLVVATATDVATFDPEIAQRVAASQKSYEDLIVQLIGEGQADGSIPAHVDKPVTARALLCILQGMRVIGKTGRSRTEMAAVVEVALKVLA